MFSHTPIRTGPVSSPVDDLSLQWSLFLFIFFRLLSCPLIFKLITLLITLCLPPSFSLSFSIALSFPWTPTSILPESRAAWKRGSCGVRWLWGRPSDTSVWFIPLSLQLIASREREKLMVSNKQPPLFHYWLEFWELKFVQSLSSCQKGYIMENGIFLSLE